MAPAELNNRRKTKLIWGSLLFLLNTLTAQAQVSAYTVQNLGFGAFSHGSTGGTVVIAPNGGRFATGDVILVNLGFQFSPAIFEVEAPEGTIISIATGSDTQLTGSNGGSMTLHISSIDPGPSFISYARPPSRSIVKVGATLSVSGPGSNPPGSYSGSFAITFIQE
jgi:hypothetical protein